jgi:hypothetical protein
MDPFNIKSYNVDNAGPTFKETCRSTMPFTEESLFLS